jgi:cellulose synthase/poly-beta-1,6-N-acetylglucosamine synthase-like glycosyltransferase
MTTLPHIALVVALAALAYTFAGYALLVAVWAKLAPRPVRRAAFQPRVAIVIVVHNGAAVIGRKVRTCLEQDYPPGKLRVLVASDGSSDATCAVVEALGDARVELLAFPRRRGKAACLNDAVARCAEEVIVFTDARQPLDPLALRHLLANLGDADVGAVSGQLVFERDDMTAFGEGLDAYWRHEKFLRRTEGRIHSAVGVTGALYALRRECFRELPADTVLDDLLIPMNVVLQGRRVVFEDHALVFDRSSRDGREERSRKVRTLAGNFQLVSRHPGLLSPWRNPIALQFASHKLMRLAAPLALAVALVANVALAGEGPWFAAMLALQLAGYGCAALGMLWPRANGLRPVKLANAFLTLNWFVVLGFVEFVSNRRAHLWKKAA